MNRRAMAAPVSKYCRAALSAAVAATLVLLVPACSSGTSDADAPLAGAKIGGPFTLVGKDGRTVRYSDFDGKYRILYFGYTFCPDVCPTTLADEAAALGKLPPAEAARIQPLFITVDPERDTPKVVKGYAATFYPRMVGLTGSVEQITAVERAYKVYAAKAPGENGAYTMDHSSIIYLMGPDGRFLAHFAHGVSVDQMAEELHKYLSAS